MIINDENAEQRLRDEQKYLSRLLREIAQLKRLKKYYEGMQNIQRKQ